MYAVSPLFQASLRQAKEDGADVAILSAKYGLIPIDRVIEPYDLSLEDLNHEEQSVWASMVMRPD